MTDQPEVSIRLNESGQFAGGSYEADLNGPTAVEPEATADPAPNTESPASLELAPPADPQRPAWLPAKFKSPEEMAASYTELEKKLGAPAKPADPAPAADPAKATKETAVAAGVTEAELAAYANEVNANGALSPASYAALAAKGLPKSLVDTHVAGLQALRQGVMDRALAEVGGATGYQKIADWARANLDKGAQDQYNRDVNSGDPARVQYAVTGLKARHDAAVGHPSARAHGRRAPAGAQGFADKTQQVAAQSDSRYWSDPNFRAEVERQIAASTYTE